MPVPLYHRCAAASTLFRDFFAKAGGRLHAAGIIAEDIQVDE